LTNISKKGLTAAALGIFDGVHLGHRRVIDLAVKKAEEIGAEPAVFTFNTGTVTSKGRFEPLITDEDKAERLHAMGIKSIRSFDFGQLCGLTAERFVKEILSDTMNAACAVCGEDFRFGRNGAADAEDLKRICAECGIEVCTVGQLEIDGAAVSSTRIRELIKSGEIARANRLLGYRYGYTLTVEHGFERGRTWDFPTVNQAIPEGLVLPKFGVYCSKVLIDGVWYAGVTNIGVKPTVEKASPPLAETFIIGFSGDLYGKRLPLELYEFVRPEKIFPSFDELKAEIGRNTEFTKRYFNL
jgi:riboflavin kinase/FMN adenylyltransferase